MCEQKLSGQVRAGHGAVSEDLLEGGREAACGRLGLRGTILFPGSCPPGTKIVL